MANNVRKGGGEGLEEHYLSLSETARILGKSERTIRRWIKSGRLRASKPGRDYVIPASAVRELIEESEVYPKDLMLTLFNAAQEQRRPPVELEGQMAAEAAFSGELMERIKALAEDFTRELDAIVSPEGYVLLEDTPSRLTQTAVESVAAR